MVGSLDLHSWEVVLSGIVDVVAAVDHGIAVEAVIVH